jgi:hypothetical protein
MRGRGPRRSFDELWFHDDVSSSTPLKQTPMCRALEALQQLRAFTKFNGGTCLTGKYLGRETRHEFRCAQVKRVSVLSQIRDIV